jgi:hypothetical protein
MAFFPGNTILKVKIEVYNEKDLTKEEWLKVLESVYDVRINKRLLSDLFDRCEMSASDFSILKDETIPLLVKLIPDIHYNLSVRF